MLQSVRMASGPVILFVRQLSRSRRINARGVHWRGEGRDEERQLAEKHDNWAKSLEFSYPRVSEIHRQMGKSYRRDAMREDNEAEVRRRLLD